MYTIRVNICYWLSHLCDASAKAHPLEHLMKGERNHKRPDCTDILGHPHCNPDDDGVEDYPNLQHFGHHLLLPPGLLLVLPGPLPYFHHFMGDAMAAGSDDVDLVAARGLPGPEKRHVVAVRVGAVGGGVRRGVLLSVVVQERALLGAHLTGELEHRDLLGDWGVGRFPVAVGVGVGVPADVGVGLEVGGSREVDEEREQRADEGEETREGEVPPGPARGDGAVGERGVRVGEHVDERGGEDDPCRVALDEEQAPRVAGAAAERARERDGEADADGAGDEDGQQRPRLEPRGRRAVAAGPGERRAAGGEAPGAGHGASAAAARGGCSTELPHCARRATATGGGDLAGRCWSVFGLGGGNEGGGPCEMG